METTITTSLIGASATIIGAIIGAYKNEIMGLLSGKKKGVTGTWEGKAIYWSVNQPDIKRERIFTCELIQRQNHIKGKLTSSQKQDGSLGTVYNVYGKVFETEYITLIIENMDNDIVNYASSILKYTKNRKELTGNLIGRSRSLNGIVGTIKNSVSVKVK